MSTHYINVDALASMLAISGLFNAQIRMCLPRGGGIVGTNLITKVEEGGEVRFALPPHL